MVEPDKALFSALKENVIQLPRAGPTFYRMECRRSDVPSSHFGEKGTTIGTNQMPWSIRTTATSLIFSGKDDLIDSCSGIAGKVLRGCRIGSQAHSVALSLHNPNSIGLIVPIYVGFLSLKLPYDDPTTAYDSHDWTAGPLPSPTSRS
jgi:hypothetical protein